MSVLGYVLFGVYCLGSITDVRSIGMRTDLVMGTARAVTPFVAVFLYAAASGEGAGAVAAALGHPVLTSLGEITMPMYMLHWPLAELFVLMGGAPCLFTAVGSLRYMAILLALSALCVRYVEKPATGLMLWLARGRRTATPPTPAADEAKQLGDAHGHAV